MNDQLKKDEKNGDITEDELRSGTEDVQKATDNSIKEIDQMIADKRKRYYVSIKLIYNDILKCQY